MDSLAEYLIEEVESESDSESSNRIRNWRLRDALDLFDLPDSEFSRNFRMNKDCFRKILEELAPKLKKTFYVTAVSAEHKLATFLRFLASGSYQKCIANACFAVVSQTTASRIITECLSLFESDFCAKWISIELTAEEELEAKAHFYTKFGLPGVIGCVDGSHIRICSPPQDLKHLYYNRKGYYSINAMMICDHNMVVRCVDATHPGANHDAYVWRLSPADLFLKTKYNSGKRNTWLLGDSGYQLHPYLMTPFRNPEERHRRIYNERHCKARNIIERCFGVIKNRFRCLSGERTLHYCPERVTQIVNACCALHNICIHYKNNWPYAEFESSFEDGDRTEPPTQVAIDAREELARNVSH